MATEKLSNVSVGKPRGRNGGRKKGIPNKKTLVQASEVEASGLTPLQYMLEVMRDETEDRPRRLYAAQMAAPYVHAKLSSVALSGEVAFRTVKEMTENELLAVAQGSGD